MSSINIPDFIQLIRTRNLSSYDTIAKSIGDVSSTAVFKWGKGRCKPSKANLAKLADVYPDLYKEVLYFADTEEV